MKLSWRRLMGQVSLLLNDLPARTKLQFAEPLEFRFSQIALLNNPNSWDSHELLIILISTTHLNMIFEHLSD